MPRPPTPATLERLKDVVGPSGWLDDPHDLGPHLIEGLKQYQGRTPLLVRPASTEQVAAVVRICAQADAAIVPQGGNTGLVGGQIPAPSGEQIIVSLERLRRVRAVDTANNTLTVEAGCTLAAVQAAAAEVDRLFPLSLAAEGSCQIGGNLATNAGGIHVLRYGNARDLVLGLEVVTPSGDIWGGLRALRKDNTGYDLKHLFLGAEGTLGIITAAVLKLFPRHRHVQTLLVAVPSLEAAVALLSHVRDAVADAVLACELLCRRAVEFVVRHIPGAVDPMLEPSPWYVVMDLTVKGDVAEEVLASATGAGHLTDAVLARSPAQAAALWKLREGISEAQKPEGASIKHDISLPVSRLCRFVPMAIAAALRVIPDARPVPFGHLGDGNLHFNFSQPEGGDGQAFKARAPDVHQAVHDLVVAAGGSISAEHGIGVAKRDEIRRYKDPIEIVLMSRIKAALDPQGIMNPGKGVA